MKSKEARIELLIMACSAGGMILLMDLLASLQKNVRFAVLVIVHRNDRYQSSLEQMAQQRCQLRVKSAEEKEILQAGTVYFAPAGYHLLIENDHSVSLDVSEPVHYCRPSIDVSMQSAAEVYKESLLAILLSGANRDGAEGIHAISRYGGITVVQDPNDAEVDIMPRAAIATGAVSVILSDEQLEAYCTNLQGEN
ncbi:chemotaxis protein CheB [Olivibacter sp. CPCC 100613]|uniref:chemotaxis protein CheB n=1 Tax=Olivibacter sp. CPCC 100613 TaxID=3079931 RepID=UPI002FF721F3